MKYYKALDENMCASVGDGMQFELGKKYGIEGEVIPCENGFHFCKELKDVWNFYDLEDSRFFEVEVGDIVINADEVKSVTNSIIFIRELTKEEIDQYIKDNLEKLVHDEYWMVRYNVARRGFGLDILINDEHWWVKYEASRQKLDLRVANSNYYFNIREIIKEKLNKIKHILGCR